jgi:hypothetical protein
MNGNFKEEQCERTAQVPVLHSFEEQHYPVIHWAKRWGFSAKTLREWFQDEYGPGILRHTKTGRKKKREYTTMMISARAASRVYLKHAEKQLIH